jgi:hypothetical protein
MIKKRVKCKLCGKKCFGFTIKMCKACLHKYRKIPKCIECGKKIKNYYAKRCKKCFNKWMKENSCNFKRKNRFGENNSNFRHGKTYNNHCEDCHKLLSGYRAKRCKSCSKKGKRSVLFGKPSHHGKREKYNNILMRSSYEVKYAKYLDKQGITWLYESKTFDLGNCTYTPDFYLPETDTYIEIKGYWRDDAIKKFKLFKKLYSKINIEVLDYKKLKNLNIL